MGSRLLTVSCVNRPEGPTMPRHQPVGEDGAAGPACVVCVRRILLCARRGSCCRSDGSRTVGGSFSRLL